MTDINVTYSERGFPQFDDEITTDYGHKVRVYGSSAAMKDCVWMSVKQEPRNDHRLPPVDTAVHMDLDQATALRNRLSAWIHMINGYDDSDVVGLRDEIASLQGELREAADLLAPWVTRPED